MEAARTSQAPPGGHGAALRGSGAQPSRRRLRLSTDERLVARVRRGSEEAFATLWERYHRPLLSYCRHMLGSHEEAEDAVQQRFFNAYRALARDDDRDLAVRAWLYRIARNQCLDVLRARRPADELADDEPSIVGLSDEVADRAELRDLLHDVAALPVDQREALLLAELHDNSHAEVAEILGCERDKVKSLVFQARSSLMKSKQARDISCEEVQEQLSVLRGGSLRRSVLRRHLVECDACRLFADEVKRQRAGLAVVLPVAPVGALKLGAGTAFAAAAATSAATAGGGTAVSAGGIAGVAAKLGVPAAVVKGAVATVAVTTVAAGSAATVRKVEDSRRSATPAAKTTPSPAQPASPPSAPSAASPGVSPPAARSDGAKPHRVIPADRRRRGTKLAPGRSDVPGARVRGPQKTGPERTRTERPAKAREGQKPDRPRPTKPRRPAHKERPPKPVRVVPPPPEPEPAPLPDRSR
jgi:RNA polymerase sigma factor (sigma-70 family)